VTSVDAKMKRLTFANGAQAEFDLLAFVPPHVAPPVVRESGLIGETGWVAVDRYTLETRFPGVYAIGDVVTIPLTLGKPLPKAGVFAHGEGEVVAHRGRDHGKGTRARFDGHGECFIEIGGGKAGFGSGDFYAEPKPAVTLHMRGQARTDSQAALRQGRNRTRRLRAPLERYQTVNDALGFS